MFDLAKVHIQTIGILVSEKSELQTALQYTQQAARQKAGGCLLMMFDHGKRSLVSRPFSFQFYCTFRRSRGADAPIAVNKAESVRVGENTVIRVHATETV